MKIYFISGLGADRRAFQRIQLPAGFDAVHVEWQPVRGGEGIEEYAAMLASQIDPKEPFILAGLSFGGIMAVEICKFLAPVKLLLFSTVRTRDQLPYSYRLAGYLQLHRLLPRQLLPFSLPYLYWFFGPLNAEGKLLVASFLRNTDYTYLKWALGQISRWKNTSLLDNTIHIHGEIDRAFPCRLVAADYVIPAAGHFCVFTHAGAVNAILKAELEPLLI
ncbi:alpha/beta hydrolase [Pedobacter sp. SYSU D00535]|uniref:alpha/beta hydrolase n=1 Tax=Pedobacter sp. SYSU D00535 TaxID=2810308 RepID=UPI001A962092|nr:alpha/beta hydrolase [Pedobacter sp. SYSU D00535]